MITDQQEIVDQHFYFTESITVRILSTKMPNKREKVIRFWFRQTKQSNNWWSLTKWNEAMRNAFPVQNFVEFLGFFRAKNFPWMDLCRFHVEKKNYKAGGSFVWFPPIFFSETPCFWVLTCLRNFHHFFRAKTFGCHRQEQKKGEHFFLCHVLLWTSECWSKRVQICNLGEPSAPNPTRTRGWTKKVSITLNVISFWNYFFHNLIFDDKWRKVSKVQTLGRRKTVCYLGYRRCTFGPHFWSLRLWQFVRRQSCRSVPEMFQKQFDPRTHRTTSDDPSWLPPLAGGHEAARQIEIHRRVDPRVGAPVSTKQINPIKSPPKLSFYEHLIWAPCHGKTMDGKGALWCHAAFPQAAKHMGTWDRRSTCVCKQQTKNCQKTFPGLEWWIVKVLQDQETNRASGMSKAIVSVENVREHCNFQLLSGVLWTLFVRWGFGGSCQPCRWWRNRQRGRNGTETFKVSLSLFLPLCSWGREKKVDVSHFGPAANCLLGLAGSFCWHTAPNLGWGTWHHNWFESCIVHDPCSRTKTLSVISLFSLKPTPPFMQQPLAWLDHEIIQWDQQIEAVLFALGLKQEMACHCTLHCSWNVSFLHCNSVCFQVKTTPLWKLKSDQMQWYFHESPSISVCLDGNKKFTWQKNKDPISSSRCRWNVLGHRQLHAMSDPFPLDSFRLNFKICCPLLSPHNQSGVEFEWFLSVDFSSQRNPELSRCCASQLTLVLISCLGFPWKPTTYGHETSPFGAKRPILRRLFVLAIAPRNFPTPLQLNEQLRKVRACSDMSGVWSQIQKQKVTESLLLTRAQVLIRSAAKSCS